MITFTASLKPTGSPIKISAEGETTVTLVIPASDLPEAIKLTMFRDRLLNVTVKIDNEISE